MCVLCHFACAYTMVFIPRVPVCITVCILCTVACVCVVCGKLSGNATTIVNTPSTNAPAITITITTVLSTAITTYYLEIHIIHNWRRRGWGTASSPTGNSIIGGSTIGVRRRQERRLHLGRTTRAIRSTNRAQRLPGMRIITHTHPHKMYSRLNSSSPAGASRTDACCSW